jgi:hypothetical protein
MNRVGRNSATYCATRLWHGAEVADCALRIRRKVDPRACVVRSGQCADPPPEIGGARACRFRPPLKGEVQAEPSLIHGPKWRLLDLRKQFAAVSSEIDRANCFSHKKKTDSELNLPLEGRSKFGEVQLREGVDAETDADRKCKCRALAGEGDAGQAPADRACFSSSRLLVSAGAPPIRLSTRTADRR